MNVCYSIAHNTYSTTLLLSGQYIRYFYRQLIICIRVGNLCHMRCCYCREQCTNIMLSSVMILSSFLCPQVVQSRILCMKTPHAQYGSDVFTAPVSTVTGWDHCEDSEAPQHQGVLMWIDLVRCAFYSVCYGTLRGFGGRINRLYNKLHSVE